MARRDPVDELAAAFAAANVEEGPSQVERQLYAAYQQLRAELEALRAHAPPAGDAAVGGAVAAAPRYNIKFDTFDFSGDDPQAAFDRFETNVRMVSQVMRYQVPDVCYAVLGQLRGRAADIGRSLVGTERTYASLDTFLMRLRELFVSPAYQEQARAAFQTLLQGQNKIIIFHGQLKALFDKAFTGVEKQERMLIRRFIAGLTSEKIAEQLHLNFPPTYQVALTEALRLEGTYDIVRQEKRWRESGARGALNMPTTMHDAAPAPMIAAGAGGVEPMEIGQLNKKKGFKPGFKPKKPKKPQGTQVARDQCKRCLQHGHWERECRAPPKKGTGNGNGAKKMVAVVNETKN
jgi:hypothetical protein